MFFPIASPNISDFRRPIFSTYIYLLKLFGIHTLQKSSFASTVSQPGKSEANHHHDVGLQNRSDSIFHQKKTGKVENKWLKVKTFVIQDVAYQETLNMESSNQGSSRLKVLRWWSE